MHALRRSRGGLLAPVLWALFLFSACQGSGGAAFEAVNLDPSELPYATEVVSFSPGEGAGFGSSSLPGIVLGPPNGGNGGQGSLDVLSLGVGGEIVLGFGDRIIVDGPGPDFIVFENAFQTGGDVGVWAELGEVAVASGERFVSYSCDADEETTESWSGCAGWTPTADFAFLADASLEPVLAGGDAFDLADLGLESARFVRIRDLASGGSPPTAGFDLDAVGLVNWVWIEEYVSE